MKQGVTRLGGAKVKIDLLRCQEEVVAGTFSEDDRATLERILPGIHKTLVRRALEKGEQSTGRSEQERAKP